MTPRESEKTGELLMSMAKKHTLLVIEHDMTFVRQIAQTVTVLDEGKVLCEGTVDEVQSNPKVIEVYLGHDKKEVAPHAPVPAPHAAVHDNHVTPMPAIHEASQLRPATS